MALTAQDEADIRKVLDDYMRLWMAGQAQACADLYEPSGDGLAVDGTFLRGRDEIKRYYDDVMDGKYAGLTVESVQTVGIRPLGPDVALLDASWQVHGPSTDASPSTLIADVNCCLVLTRAAGEWKISAARMMVPMQTSG